MKLALAGDTMLGRKVAEHLAEAPPASHFDAGVVEAAREADLFLLNLECAISERGAPWPDPAKPFFFRAPPAAVDVLQHLGVACATVANNHALDYGADALLDTSPGVAFADLRRGPPRWLPDAIAGADVDVVVVSPHWGPNMVAEPVPHVRAAATAFRTAGASLVAGHSAHVFRGVADRVLYDLGDFIDDYATDARLRNEPAPPSRPPVAERDGRFVVELGTGGGPVRPRAGHHRAQSEGGPR